MTDSKIIDLTEIAYDFPEDTQIEIPREALISTIETIVEDGAPLVFLEGREGIGKTTLLAQFARENKKRTFSIFLSGSNRYSFEIPYIRMNLLNQLYWFINGVKLPSDHEEADDAILREKIRAVIRKAQFKGEHFYFVVDGIVETEDEKSIVVDYIYDILPIGAKGVSVLISGEQSKLKPKNLKKIGQKALPVSPFSYSETKTFLSNNKLSSEDV